MELQMEISDEEYLSRNIIILSPVTKLSVCEPYNKTEHTLFGKYCMSVSFLEGTFLIWEFMLFIDYNIIDLEQLPNFLQVGLKSEFLIDVNKFSKFLFQCSNIHEIDFRLGTRQSTDQY